MFNKFLSLIFTLLAMPAMASSSSLEDTLQPCIKEAVNLVGRPRNISKVEVTTKYKAESTDYYQATLFPQGQPWAWNVVISVVDNRCSYVGDNFVEDYGLYGNLSDSIVQGWVEQDLPARIETVGKSNLRNQIVNYQGGWHPGEVKAFKSFGLWH